MADSKVQITQRRSSTGASPRQRATLQTLGLRGIGRTVERRDGPELRGMIRAVEHLVEVSDTSRPPASRGAGSSQDQDA